MQKLFSHYSAIGIALIILGVLGFIYAVSVLLHEKLWSIIYDKVDIDILNYCIGKTRSMNYGEIIYFPYIEYQYIYNQKEYQSCNVYWDFESCYETEWTKSNIDNNDIVLANEKVKQLIESKEAYVLKLLPSIAYLNINLSKKRKKYFLFMSILAIIILFAGIYSL